MSWQYSFNDFAELFFFKRKMIAQHTSLEEKKYEYILGFQESMQRQNCTYREKN